MTLLFRKNDKEQQEYIKCDYITFNNGYLKCYILTEYGDKIIRTLKITSGTYFDTVSSSSVEDTAKR